MYDFTQPPGAELDPTIPLQGYTPQMSDPLTNALRLRRAINKLRGIDTSEDDDTLDLLGGATGKPSLANLLWLRAKSTGQPFGHYQR